MTVVVPSDDEETKAIVAKQAAERDAAAQDTVKFPDKNTDKGPADVGTPASERSTPGYEAKHGNAGAADVSPTQSRLMLATDDQLNTLIQQAQSSEIVTSAAAEMRRRASGEPVIEGQVTSHNQYDSLVAPPPTETTAPAPEANRVVNEYSAFIPDGPTPETTKAMLAAAAETDPDKHAKVLELAGKTGIPPDVVARNEEEVTAQQAAAEGSAHLQSAPVTQRWIAANPDNAIVAQDSTKQLSLIEQGFNTLRSVPAGFIENFGSGFRGLGTAYEDISRSTMQRPLVGALKALGMDDLVSTIEQKEIPWWFKPSGVLEHGGQQISEVGKVIDIPPEDKNWVTDVAGGVGQVAAQITTAILAPELMLPLMFGSGVDAVADDTKKAGAHGTAAGDTAELAGGVITGATNKFGLEIVLHKIPAAVHSYIGRILAGATTEAAQEITEGVLNNLTAIGLYDPTRQVLDWQTFYQAGVAGPVGAIVSAVIPGHAAKRARKTMGDINKDATSSPMTERDPDKAVEHIAATAQATGLEAFVPVETIEKIMASDPVAAQVFAGRAEEAKLRGGDVKLSEQEFARHVILSDDFDTVADQVRIGPGGMNAAEADKLQETLAEDRKSDRNTMPAGVMLPEALKPAEEEALVDPTVVSSKQKKQLTEAGFTAEEIKGMSPDQVIGLLGAPKQPADKWHRAAVEAVDLAEEQMGLQGIFRTAKEAGMTEPQYASYLVAVAQAREGTVKRMHAAVLRQEQRQATAEWKAERDHVRQEVVEHTNQEPVYSALNAIGVDRLHKESVVEAIGEEGLDRLPKQEKGRLIYADAGIHPDVLAEQHGFVDGRAMLQAMMRSAPFDVAVDTATDQKMHERHGNLLDKRQAITQAIEDLHTDKQADLLASELHQLKGAQQGGKVSAKTFAKAARERLHKLQVSEIHPARFLSEETRKAKEVGKALSKGNRSDAIKAKFQQLLNFQYARVAFDIRREVEKQRKQLANLARPRKVHQTIDAGHMDQIHELLNGYDFSTRAPAGAGITGPVHYSTLSLNAWNELYEQAKRLETQGRKWKSYFIKGRELDFADVKTGLLEAADKLPTLGRMERQRIGKEGYSDGAKSTLAGVQAQIKKVELMLKRLDGAIAGVWHRAIFQPIADAQTAELDWMDKTMKPLLKGLKAFPKDVRARMRKKVEVPLLGRYMSLSEIMMVALNSGNTSNFQKMIEGSKKDNGAKPWTEAGVQQALSHLGPQEAAWIQSVWDHFETMRPHVEAIYRSENGIAPERVEAREIHIAGKTLKGGYFPMLYDQNKAPQNDRQTALEAMQDPFVLGSVFSGMTKARVEKYSAPVQLDLTKLTGALRQSVHFMTHYEAVRDVRKVLGDKEIAGAIRNKIGPEYEGELKSWLEAVATNGADRTQARKWNEVIQYFRTNLTAAILGFSYTTGLSQLFGLSTTVSVLGEKEGGGFSNTEGAKWLAVGLDQYAANPIESTKEAFALSGELRHRLGNSDRDLAQTLSKVTGKTGFWAMQQRASLMMIGGIQLYTVDLPTWLGAFNKGLAQGKTEADAVNFADSVLRTSQASGHIKDLSALQRQKGIMQWVTMFSTYSMLLYNLQVDTVKGVKSVKDVPGAIAKLGWLVAIPAVMQALMQGQGAPEDGEGGDDAAWWALQMTKYSLASIPVIGRGISSAIDGYTPTLSTVEALGSTWQTAFKHLYKSMQDSDYADIKALKAGITAAGFTFGLGGTVQIVRVLSAIEQDGDATAYEYLIGHKKPKK